VFRLILGICLNRFSCVKGVEVGLSETHDTVINYSDALEQYDSYHAVVLSFDSIYFFLD
jgi:hypothetical protein